MITRGTEERNQFMNSYTVYKVMILSGPQSFQLSFRYRELKELENIVTRDFKKINNLPTLPKTFWFANHKAKVCLVYTQICILILDY